MNAVTRREPQWTAVARGQIQLVLRSFRGPRPLVAYGALFAVIVLMAALDGFPAFVVSDDPASENGLRFIRPPAIQAAAGTVVEAGQRSERQTQESGAEERGVGGRRIHREEGVRPGPGRGGPPPTAHQKRHRAHRRGPEGHGDDSGREDPDRALLQGLQPWLAGAVSGAFFR